MWLEEQEKDQKAGEVGTEEVAEQAVALTSEQGVGRTAAQIAASAFELKVEKALEQIPEQVTEQAMEWFLSFHREQWLQFVPYQLLLLYLSMIQLF